MPAEYEKARLSENQDMIVQGLETLSEYPSLDMVERVALYGGATYTIRIVRGDIDETKAVRIAKSEIAALKARVKELEAAILAAATGCPFCDGNWDHRPGCIRAAIEREKGGV